VTSVAFAASRYGWGTDPRSPALAISPDGTRAAVEVRTGICVYDTRTWDVRFEMPAAAAAGFTADGTGLLTLDPSRKQVSVRDPVDGRVRRTVAVAFEPAATSRAVSPSGRYVAWGLPDGDLEVARVDRDPAEVRRVRTGHAGAVSAVAIDREDRWLATGGADGTARLWDLEAARPGPVFRGHDNRVTAVAFDPAGTRLASVGWGPEAKVWDLTRLHESVNLGGNPRPGVRRVEDCVFTPEGRDLLMVRVPGGDLERWDPATGRRTGVRTLDLATSEDGLVIPGRAAAFSADARRLAAVSGADPRRVQVWDTAGGGPLPLDGTTGSVEVVVISSDGSHVAAATRGADLVVWDAATGEVVRRFPIAGETCSALALAADGQRLAAGLSDDHGHEIRVWDLESGQVIHTLASNGEVRAVTFDGPGDRLAAVTAEPRLLLWDARTGRLQHSVPCLDGYWSLAFAPDGRRLAGASREVMTLWDPTDGGEILTLRGQPRGGIDIPFNPRIAFDPTGRQLAATQADNTVTVWTAAGYPGR
jgi:WD40 repeat protein